MFARIFEPSRVLHQPRKPWDRFFRPFILSRRENTSQLKLKYLILKQSLAFLQHRLKAGIVVNGMHQTSLFILMLLAVFWAAWHFAAFAVSAPIQIRDDFWRRCCLLIFQMFSAGLSSFLVPSTVYVIRYISLCFVFFSGCFCSPASLNGNAPHAEHKRMVAQYKHSRKPWKAVKSHCPSPILILLL